LAPNYEQSAGQQCQSTYTGASIDLGDRISPKCEARDTNKQQKEPYRFGHLNSPLFRITFKYGEEYTRPPPITDAGWVEQSASQN
jgi:hypothetical protein